MPGDGPIPNLALTVLPLLPGERWRQIVPKGLREVPQVRGDHKSRPRHVECAHDAQYVRPIVRRPAARVGEAVRILTEREVRAASDELTPVRQRPSLSRY